jgi:hypothetical protein
VLCSDVSGDIALSLPSVCTRGRAKKVQLAAKSVSRTCFARVTELHLF